MKQINYVILVLFFIVLSSFKSNIEEADNLLHSYKYEQAYEIYKNAAEEGDAYAKWRLSSFYANGRVVDFNQEKALSLIFEASKGGCEEAICDEALINLYGYYGKPKNTVKGKLLFDNLIKKTSNAHILCRYASFLSRENPFYEENQEKALKILNSIKDKENMEYLRAMGDIYSKGCDTIKTNIYKAFEYYSKAFEHGYSYCAFIIADKFYNGKGIKKDLYKSAEWYEKGVAVGQTYCMLGLGLLFVNAPETNKDLYRPNEGINYIKKAVNHGNSDAMALLGYYYMSGNGVEKNNEKAFKYFKKSFDLGCSVGGFRLGFAYCEGIGCKKNITLGIKAWEKSADLGFGDSANNLYVMYHTGQYGIAKNNTKARYYLKRAVKLGDANACMNMGVNYYYGKDLFKKNLTEAYFYVKKAADLGHKKACELVSYMLENGLGCSVDLEMARKYAEKQNTIKN